jgi:hypothetical protein
MKCGSGDPDLGLVTHAENGIWAAALHLRASYPSPLGAKGIQEQPAEMKCGSPDPILELVASLESGRALPHFISAPPTRAPSAPRGSKCNARR